MIFMYTDQKSETHQVFTIQERIIGFYTRDIVGKGSEGQRGGDRYS